MEAVMIPGYRMSSFPFDWLAPGERTYCPGGEHLVAAGDPNPCPLCSPRDGTVYPDLSAQLEASRRHVRRLEDTTRLAEYRRASGVKPLFWM